MKNLVNFFLVFFLTITNITHLHSQVEATSPASAQVESALTLMREAGTEIDFGILSATTPGDIILDPRGSSSNENTGTDTGVARFNLGGADQNVTLLYNATIDLEHEDFGGGGLPGVNAKLVMTPIINGDGFNTNQAIPNDSNIANGTQILPINGTYFFWVGGSIPQLEDVITGTYTGMLTFGVEYQ